MAQAKNQKYNLADILLQVHGIGPALCGRIIETYPTLEALHKQTVTELASRIKGLSPTKAKELKKLAAQIVKSEDYAASPSVDSVVQKEIESADKKSGFFVPEDESVPAVNQFVLDESEQPAKPVSKAQPSPMLPSDSNFEPELNFEGADLSSNPAVVEHSQPVAIKITKKAKSDLEEEVLSAVEEVSHLTSVLEQPTEIFPDEQEPTKLADDSAKSDLPDESMARVSNLAPEQELPQAEPALPEPDSLAEATSEPELQVLVASGRKHADHNPPFSTAEKPPIKWHSPLEVNYNSQSIQIPVKSKNMFFGVPEQTQPLDKTVSSDSISTPVEPIQTTELTDLSVAQRPADHLALKVDSSPDGLEAPLAESVIQPAENFDTRQEVINNFATFRKAQVHLNYDTNEQKKLVGKHNYHALLVGIGMMLVGAGMLIWLLPFGGKQDNTTPASQPADIQPLDKDNRFVSWLPAWDFVSPQEPGTVDPELPLEPGETPAPEPSAEDNPPVVEPPVEEPPAITPETPPQEPLNQDIPYDQISVKVLNGNGVRGVGLQVTNSLKSAGFVTQSTDNADRFNYNQTTIFYAEANQAKAETLRKFLDSDYDLAMEPRLFAGQTSDLVLVVGLN